VDAFQATLQEAIDADLLLHVVDAANVDYPEQIAQVQAVLKEIGADDIPQLLVFNKVDAIAADAQPLRLEDAYEIEGLQTPRLFVSARNLTGMSLLRQKLAEIAKSSTDSNDLPSIHPEPTGDGT